MDHRFDNVGRGVHDGDLRELEKTGVLQNFEHPPSPPRYTPHTLKPFLVERHAGTPVGSGLAWEEHCSGMSAPRIKKSDLSTNSGGAKLGSCGHAFGVLCAMRRLLRDNETTTTHAA